LLPAVALAAAVIVVTALGLVTGASWLVADPLGTGLPLGTLATAASMVLLPALSLPWAVDRWTRGAAWTLAVAGALWLPVSAVMAGNLRLSFVAAPGWWWPVTVALPLLALSTLLIVVALAATRRWRRGDRKSG